MTERRNVFSIGTSAPLAKIGFQMPLPVAGKAFSPEETRHNFAVRALKKPGFFARRSYIHLCVRCRQIFLVDEHRGSIVAIDRDRNPLPEPENSKQVETFAEGPCPSFKFASKFPRQSQPTVTVKSSMMKLRLLRALVSLSNRAQAVLASAARELLV